MLSPTGIPLAYGSTISHIAMSIENADAEEKPVSQEKQRILNEMEPLVKQVLDCCDENAVAKLVELNRDMIETNVKENLFPMEHCVPVPHLVRANRKRTCLMQTMLQSQASVEDLEQAAAARGELQTLQSSLRTYMAELKLPPSWTFEIPDLDTHRSAEQQRITLSRAIETDACATEPTSPLSSNARDVTCHWAPGQTTRGEEILGYRPITFRGISTGTLEPDILYKSMRFVIEKKGQSNRIAIVGVDRVGLAAKDAYFNLPKERRCNIAFANEACTPLDSFSFGDITGVARDPNATAGNRLPWTVVQINYNGSRRLINRTALRNAIGKQTADDRINEFLIDADEEPDVPKDVRRPRQTSSAAKQHEYCQHFARYDTR